MNLELQRSKKINLKLNFNSIVMNTLMPPSVKSTTTEEMSCPFAENLEVYYEDRTGKTIYGHIRFICDEYVTVCIHEGRYRVNDCCLIFYPDQWDKLIPVVSKRTQ